MQHKTASAAAGAAAGASAGAAATPDWCQAATFGLEHEGYLPPAHRPLLTPGPLSNW